MDFISNFDKSILYYVYENWHNNVTEPFFVFISSISNFGFIWIAMAVVMLCKKEWRTCGIILLLSLGLSELLGSLVIKNIVCRVRPFNADKTLQLIIGLPGGEFSFPSGHSVAAGTGAAVILFRKRLFGLIVTVYSLLLAFSRIFLVVHYPTDVLAGLALGAVCAVIMWKLLYSRIESKLNPVEKVREKQV